MLFSWDGLIDKYVINKLGNVGKKLVLLHSCKVTLLAEVKIAKIGNVEIKKIKFSEKIRELQTTSQLDPLPPTGTKRWKIWYLLSSISYQGES